MGQKRKREDNIGPAPKIIRVTDAAFQPALEDNGVEYPEIDTPKPDNFDDLRERLGTRRDSIDKTDVGALQKKFLQEIKKIQNENGAKDAFYSLRGGDDRFLHVKDYDLCNLDRIFDNIVKPKADYVEGVQLSELSPDALRQLKKLVAPGRRKTAPAMCNFFIEVKGKDALLRDLLNQAVLDALYGVRAMHSYRAHFGATDDRIARTLVLTYEALNNTFAVYCGHRQDGTYIVSEVEALFLKKPNDFELAIKMLRNGREWSEEQRQAAIDLAEGSDNRVPAVVKQGVRRSGRLATRQ
ncbi:MAG: hypothetical protein LQ340_003035 [Diploschistes diacapsis]|nr:MAG: hypothetical protein LQ340_003035 [Diploschistes diacapsis]